MGNPKSVIKFGFLIFVIFGSQTPGAAAGELSIKEWEERHSAEPVLYYSKEYKVDFYADGTFKALMKGRYGIINEEGKDEGDVTFSYDLKRQKVLRAEARIITPDGRTRPRKMVREIDESSVGDYSDLRKMVLVMPDAVPGSVIEYEVEIQTLKSPLEGEFFQNLVLFEKTPFKKKTIALSFPEGLKVNFQYLNTGMKPRIELSGGKIAYYWEFVDDEIYHEKLLKERDLPPILDVLPALLVSTVSDWGEVAGWYGRIFERNTVLTPAIRAKVEEIAGGERSEEAKIRAIHRYIYDNFRYVELAFDDHAFEPHAAGEVFDNKFGDCKDQTAVMVCMLRAAGIKADPALVAVFAAGDPSSLLPMPQLFDHVIAAVECGGRTCYVDPLIDGYGPGDVPEDLEGRYVLVAGEGAGRFERIPYKATEDKTSSLEMEMVIGPDGTTEISMSKTFNKDDSVRFRGMLESFAGSREKEFLSAMNLLLQDGQIEELQWLNREEPQKPLGIRFKSTHRRYFRVLGDIMVLGSGQNDTFADFPDGGRRYPIFFPGESVEKERCTFVLPEGFKVQYLPGDADITSEWYDAVVQYRGGKGRIVREVIEHSKRVTVPPGKYGELRKFFLDMKRALEDAIVIQRV